MLTMTITGTVDNGNDHSNFNFNSNPLDSVPRRQTLETTHLTTLHVTVITMVMHEFQR